AHFVEKISRALGRTPKPVTPEAMAALERYHWPGNVRELENVIERAIVLGSGETLDVDALPPALLGPRTTDDLPLDLPPGGLDLDDLLDRIEQRYLELALRRTGGVQTRAAELLGLSFRQFRYKLQKHLHRAARNGDDPSG
ncbi:MAG TPA: helix-turn-helix domain-containing protein, partial [Gemmatimonadales bacterium]|nr:helix-turn-helix domain-containing protein [Gemmatimonadales bacterium]